MATWSEAEWAKQVGDIRDFPTYQQGADKLRALIKTKLLKYTDLESSPSMFFHAHRMVVDPSKRGPGFFIRFTVQFNLFAGTVLGLGGDEQCAILNDYQSKGTLGCFALTEKFAGVNSGLVVNTTAVYDHGRGGFVINSPNEGAEKNWISQGLTADVAVVFADLRVKGKSYGPHGFLVAMRKPNGSVADGITLTDMGMKTIGNDLDNAAIRFTNMFAPVSTLLNRYCDVNEAGDYVQKTGEKMRIEIIGQRLLSGRIAVSQVRTANLVLLAKTHVPMAHMCHTQAALEFAKKLFAATAAYAKSKKWCAALSLKTAPRVAIDPERQKKQKLDARRRRPVGQAAAG